ncbi:T-cell-specific surface glycoprotein CD28-like [Fundulus diaphanus]
MGVCWWLLILMCCTSPNRSNANIHCRTAERTQTMFVPCPNMTGGDATFKLFRNDELICNLADRSKQCNETGADVHPDKNEKGEFIGFKLAGKESQGFYLCEGTRIYPPPVTSERKSVLVLEEGPEYPCKKEKCKRDEPVWIWIMVVALLGTYSLAVTIAAFIIWYKMKDAESQNDYINTKPKAPPNRRKRRGLQHPIPKHF